MAALQKLKENGWYLSEEGLKKVSDDGKLADVKDLIKRALDIDLREISVGGLPTDFGKHSKYDAPSAGIILQILKIRNISAPKCNEESKAAPRLLQIDFTDGHTLCNGLEFEHITALSLSTPPGTKVKLKGSIKLNQGNLLLLSTNVQKCGGNVVAMVEKWESQRALAKYGGGIRMNTSSGGPPPWIPFGQKSQHQPAGKSFQSLNGDKPKEITKETAEFLASRKEAIAEAAKLKKPKSFGGGSRQMMDHNVKRIMDKGYSEEEAKTSLKYTRNNVEKAMGNLKRRNDKFPTSESDGRPAFVKNVREERMMRKGGGKGAAIDTMEGSKPSAKVSLFDFLESKIPQTSMVTAPQTTSNTSTVTAAVQKQVKSNPFRSSADDSSTKRNPYKSSNDDSARHLPPPAALSQQSSSSYKAGPTASATINNYHEMTAEEHRAKFENNISASFANRQQRRDDDPRVGYSSRHSAAGSAAKSNNQNSNNYPSNSRYNNNANNNRNPNSASSSNVRQQSSYSTAAASDSNYQSLKSAKGRSSDSNKTSRYDDVKASTFYQSTQDKRMSASAINQLASETASMKISHSKTSRQPSQTQKSQQQQQQLQQPPQTKNAFEKVFPQMPNGFEYNPYKIMGFQNKETNEFAMNVLKTQNFDSVPQQVSTGSSSTASGKPLSMPSVNASPQPPTMAHVQMADAFVPMQNFNKPPPPLPSQHYIGTMAGVPPAQLSMVPAAVTFNNNWHWKINDICFAKYWEDGRYYHAEITGMAEKTCVVQFMEYGNFEEVLLTDCLPITEANIQMINQYNSHLMQQQTMHYAAAAGPPVPQQQSSHRGMRNDQQMYMPPAQRSNK